MWAESSAISSDEWIVEMQTKIHVAHVGDYDPDSSNGVNKALAGLVQNLRPQGVEPEVWHFSSRVHSVTHTVRDGFEVFELPSHSRTLSFVAGLPPSSRSFLEHRAKEIDLVHFHSVFVPNNPWAARHLGVPYLITPHGGYNKRVLRGRHRVIKKGWLRLCETKYVQRACQIHALHQNEANDLQSMFYAKTTIIPNGVSISEMQAPRDLDEIRRATDILFLGRVAIEAKGLDLLLKGFSRFSAEFPNHKLRLVIAGPDFRGGVRQLESLADRLDIRKRIEFSGPLFGSEKTVALRDSLAFVQTSRREGVSFSLLEALAAGSMVMITPETNLAAEVQEANVGIIVNGDPDSIAAGFRTMDLMRSNEVRDIEARARQLVKEQFAWPNIAKRVSEMYRSLLSAG